MVRIHPDPPGNERRVRRPGFEKPADRGARRRRVRRQVHAAAGDAERRSLSKAGGAVAQLGEHLLCKQGVVGSIPISSTTR